MKSRPIVVDDTQQELTQHGTSDFPMSMDIQPLSIVSHIPHWHHEIQINLVTHGSLTCRTPNGDFVLKEGNGLFINSGVLHEIIPTGPADSTYICVNFLPTLIFGQLNSVIRKYYVDPILFCPALESIPLLDIPWQTEICNYLRDLCEIETAKDYGYELKLKNVLCNIWHTILINNRSVIECSSGVSFFDKQRIQPLKTFIHKNYMEKIELFDIANAGFISRSECCRLFQRVEKTTPISYLKSYRISQSLKLLTATDLCVSDIAQHTGFNSSSYFAEVFKKQMGCTPLEYRKQKKQD